MAKCVFCREREASRGSVMCSQCFNEQWEKAEHALQLAWERRQQTAFGEDVVVDADGGLLSNWNPSASHDAEDAQ